MLKYRCHFQCSVVTIEIVEMENIGEKCFDSQFYFSQTWTIYNPWLHSSAQDVPSPESAIYNMHCEPLTTTHNLYQGSKGFAGLALYNINK